MMINFFCEYLKTAIPLSILALIVILVSPLIKKHWQVPWPWIWFSFAAFFILPFSMIIQSIPEKIISSRIQLQTGGTVESIASLSQTTSEQAPMIEKVFDTVLPSIEMISRAWIIGVIFYLTYLIIGYVIFRLNIKRWRQPFVTDEIRELLEDVNHELSVKKYLPIYTCRKISTPMITGFFFPIILFPDEVYDLNELKMIIRHELNHYQRHDIWHKSFLMVATVINWYNPIIHLMNRHASKDLELRCDSDVVKDKEEEFKYQYCNVVMKSVRKGTQIRTVFTTYFSEGKKAMELRLTNLFSRERKSGLFFMPTVLVILFVITCTVSASDTSVTETPSHQINTEQIEKIVKEKDAERQMILDNLHQEVDEEKKEISIKYTGPEIKKKDATAFETTNGWAEPHILDNGEKAIYLNDKESTWKLSNGGKIKINIIADKEYYGSRGSLICGYIKDNKEYQIEHFRIDEKKEITFTAPETGEYSFYLLCVASDPIIIEDISII